MYCQEWKYWTTTKIVPFSDNVSLTLDLFNLKFLQLGALPLLLCLSNARTIHSLAFALSPSYYLHGGWRAGRQQRGYGRQVASTWHHYDTQGPSDMGVIIIIVYQVTCKSDRLISIWIVIILSYRLWCRLKFIMGFLCPEIPSWYWNGPPDMTPHNHWFRNITSINYWYCHIWLKK